MQIWFGWRIICWPNSFLIIINTACNKSLTISSTISPLFISIIVPCGCTPRSVMAHSCTRVILFPVVNKGENTATSSDSFHCAVLLWKKAVWLFRSFKTPSRMIGKQTLLFISHVLSCIVIFFSPIFVSSLLKAAMCKTFWNRYASAKFSPSCKQTINNASYQYLRSYSRQWYINNHILFSNA